MTVLITGAGGQLGADLLDAFADHTTIGLLHDELDVSSEESVWHALSAHRPHVVINAAACTDVEGCEQDPERAHRTNALGPWWLARACSAMGATLVHVSDTSVFGGDAPMATGAPPRGWTEFDRVRPSRAYGRSKAAGEQLVRQTLPAHHVVRTAGLNGGRGTNFVNAVLRGAAEGTAIRLPDDDRGSPTFTRDLAAAIREVAVTGRYGIVNRTNTGTCTAYEFAARIVEYAGAEADLAPQASADPAAIPAQAWGVLDPLHADTLGLTPLPAWDRSLHALLTKHETTPTVAP